MDRFFRYNICTANITYADSFIITHEAPAEYLESPRTTYTHLYVFKYWHAINTYRSVLKTETIWKPSVKKSILY